MANVFSGNPYDAQLAALGAVKPKEQQPNTRTVIDGVATKYQVPANILMALDEAAGGKANPESFAQSISAGVKAGKTVDAVLAEAIGDPAQAKALMDRAYDIADQLYPKATKAPEAEGGSSIVGDMGRQLGGSIVKGAGAMAEGVGQGVDTVANVASRAVNPIVQALTGQQIGESTLGRDAGVAVGDAVREVGEGIQSGVSPEGKQALMDSTPEGSIFDPANASFGKNPSLRGYAMLGADVLGSLLPVVATAVITKSPTAAAAVGGAMGGGSGSETARQLVQDAAKNIGPDGVSQLEKESALYRELVASGQTPAQALDKVTREAEQLAFLLTTPISALGGGLTGSLTTKPIAGLAGKGIAARAAGTAAISGVEEGIQEAAESMAARYGTGRATQMPIDITEGTFGDFILGALGGAPVGALAGAVNGGRDPQAAPADPTAQDPAAPLALPSPTNGGTIFADGPLGAPPRDPTNFERDPNAPRQTLSDGSGQGQTVLPGSSPVPPPPVAGGAVAPPPGPISQIAAAAPDLTPIPQVEPVEVPPMFSEMKPGTAIRLQDPSGAIVDAVFQREEGGSAIVRINGQEVGVDAAAFDQAIAGAKAADLEAENKAKGIKTPKPEAVVPTTPEMTPEQAVDAMKAIEDRAAKEGWSNELQKRHEELTAIAGKAPAAEPASTANGPDDVGGNQGVAGGRVIDPETGEIVEEGAAPEGTDPAGVATGSVDDNGVDGATDAGQSKPALTPPAPARLRDDGKAGRPTEVDYPNRKINMRKARVEAPIDGMGDMADGSFGNIALANGREGDVLPGIGTISKVTEKQVQIAKPDGSILRLSEGSDKMNKLARDIGSLIASSANLRDKQLGSLMDMIERDPALVYRGGVPMLFDDPAEQSNRGQRSQRGGVLKPLVAAEKKTAPAPEVKAEGWRGNKHLALFKRAYADPTNSLKDMRSGAFPDVADYADWLGSLTDVQLDAISPAFRADYNPFHGATFLANGGIEDARSVLTPLLKGASEAKPASGLLSSLSQEKQDRAAELKAKLAAKARTQTSSGLDPEYITLGGELVALYIEAGTKKFGQMLRDFAESTGLSMREAQAPMRAAYNHVRDDMDLKGEDISGFDNADQVMAEVRKALAEKGLKTEAAPTILSDADPFVAAGFAIPKDASARVMPDPRPGKEGNWLIRPAGASKFRVTKSHKQVGSIAIPTRTIGVFNSPEEAIAAVRADGAPIEGPEVPTAKEVAAAAMVTDPIPSKAQAEAENYRTGKISWNGMTLSIENRKGGKRRGYGKDGEVTWEVTMPAHYGRILRTEGADGDHVDFYLGDVTDSDYVMIIDQVDAKTGSFDEHKVVLGTTARGAALDIYRSAFSDGSGDKRIGGFTETNVGTFKAWLKSADMAKPSKPLSYPFAPKDFKTAAPGGDGEIKAALTKELEGAPVTHITKRGRELTGIIVVNPMLVPAQAESIDARAFRKTGEKGGGWFIRADAARAYLGDAGTSATPQTAPTAPAQPAKAKPARAKAETLQKRPLIHRVRSDIGQIDPDGTFGKEAYARGLNAQTAPFLFKRGGLKDLDNIPAAEHPEVALIVGIAEDGNYLDQDRLLELMLEEIAGRPQPVGEQATLQQEERDRIAGDAADRRADLAAEQEAGTGYEPVSAANARDWFIPDPEQDMRTSSERDQDIRDAVAEVIEGYGLDALTAAEISAIVSELDVAGGSVLGTIEQYYVRGQNDEASISTPEPSAGENPDLSGPPFGPEDAARYLTTEEGRTGTVGEDWPGSSEGSAGSGGQGNPETTGEVTFEPGADGKPQAIMPGMEGGADQSKSALTARQKAEIDARQKQSKMRRLGGNEGDAGPLFGDGPKDLFDAPPAPREPDFIDRFNAAKAKGFAKRDAERFPTTLEDITAKERKQRANERLSYVYAEYRGQRFYLGAVSGNGAGPIAQWRVTFPQAAVYSTDRADGTSINGEIRQLEESIAAADRAAAPAESTDMFGGLAAPPTSDTAGMSDIEKVVARKDEFLQDITREVNRVEKLKWAAYAKTGRRSASKARVDQDELADRYGLQKGGAFIDVLVGSVTLGIPMERKANYYDDVKQIVEGYLASRSPQTAAPAPAPQAPTPKIEDFGEKIGGARKDVWSGFKDKMEAAQDIDIKVEPLSKSWPEPDYEKLIEAGMDPWAVSFVRAARDMIPRKPGKSWKLRGWADQVKVLRDFASDILNDKITTERLKEKLATFPDLDKKISGKIALYAAVGHGQSLKDLDFGEHTYSVLGGVRFDKPRTFWEVTKEQVATAWNNMPKTLARGDTREEAIKKFKATFKPSEPTDAPKAKSGAKFLIYSQRGAEGAKYKIGVKIGSNYIDLETGIAEVKEARRIVAEEADRLQAKLDQMRTIPNERRDENAPRLGADHRSGADVSPEQFAETFGFRGVEFGNWVEQGRRKQDLNDSYDALMDLASILDIPPKAISLNGSLGLAFGARGAGGKNPAAAHFEPGMVVINLTKRSGRGSLAHEWFHALDNYFARKRAQQRGTYITDNNSPGGPLTEGIRPETVDAFLAVKRAIANTKLKERSSRIDQLRSAPYWGTGIEMHARAFESYVIAKLQDQSASNDYLANIVNGLAWSMQADLAGLGDSYPYLKPEEIETVRPKFDALFAGMERRETDKGVSLEMREDAPEDAFVGRFMRELAQVDDLFQNPISQATTLQGVFADIDPTIERKGVLPKDDPRIEGKDAEKVTLFATAKDKPFYVYETAKEVWIDVRDLGKGDGGSRIYSAISDYALNVGKLFIGDPDGLSVTALRRRTDNMLSTALKHGTTRHIAPHQYQIDGDARLGVPALRWTDGDEVGNLEALIEVSVANLISLVPEVADARYDFQTGAFRDGQGQPLTDGDLDKWASGIERNRASGAGRATVKRGVLLNTLARAESEDQPGLLERALRQQRQLVARGLSGTFYLREFAPDTDAAITADDISGITRDMNAELARTGLAGKVSVRVVRKLISHVSGNAVAGRFGAAEGIEVNAASSVPKIGIMRHEIIHALRAEALWNKPYGLFTEPEWRDLVKAARAEPEIVASVEERYPNLSAAAKSEEMVAELYRLWAGQRDAYDGVAKTLGKIEAFLRAMANMLRGRGFGSAALTMERIASGRIGGRGPQGPGGRGAQNPTKTDSPAFKRWFGDSKVVDAQGRPQMVYHGTTSDFGAFSKDLSSRAAKAFFFASAPDMASGYAAGEGGNVMPVYLSMQNPLVKDMEGLSYRRVGIGTLIAQAKDQGRDGVIIRNVRDADLPTDVFIAVEPTQIKSALNNGAFDPTNPNMSEMRALPGTVRDKFKGLVGFRNWRDPRDFLRNLTTDMMTGDNMSLLALVPGRALFAEMGRGLLSTKRYLRAKEEMDTLRNDWHADAAAVASEWIDMQKKNPEANEALMDLMHRSTMTGVDPSKPDTWGKDDNFLRTAKIEVSRLGEKAPDWAKQKMADAAKRKTSYTAIKALYDALPPEYQAFYVKVKESYEKMADDFDQALEDNIRQGAKIALKRAEKEHRKRLRQIEDDGLTGDERTEAIEEADLALSKVRARAQSGAAGQIKAMRKVFEGQRLKGPYFPLARFGDYFVTVRDEDGKVINFSRFENEKRQQTFRAEQEELHPGRVSFGLMSKKGDMRDQVDPKFVSDVEMLLADSGASAEVMDAIWQRYLETMPDQSIRTSKIHRKGREGFNKDALRSYTSHTFHGAHQLARLKYGLELQDSLDDAEDEARRADDPNRATALVNEMRKRMDWTMNPTGSSWSAFASSAAFVWYLGVSPAAALVNLTQTTVIGPAVFKAGLRKASMGNILSELGRAAKDFGKGQGVSWKDTWSAENSESLSADELAAMKEGYRRGTIDKTQAHDLASVAESGVEFSPFREKWMRRIGWAFHHAERVNREVTFLAAYRLARADGLDHGDAIEKASDLTWKTHFSYQNSDRPRFMQGDIPKVIFIFRQFSVNLLYRLFRDAHQSLQGATKAERKEARTQLVGISLSMMAHAGIKGVWGYGLIMMLLGMFIPGADDDDIEEWMQDALLMEGDSLGVAAANYAMGAFLNGVPGQLTGADLTERIGSPNLWFRGSDRNLEGEDVVQHYINELAGPIGGIAYSVFGRGIPAMAEGEVVRGVEALTPKFIRDIVRTGRFAAEGATTRNGDTLIENVNPWELILQANGFTPARLAERYDINTRLKNKEKEVTDERKDLHRAASDAIKAGEPIPEKVMEEIRDFNSRFPEYPITGDTIKQSYRGRLRASERNEFGIALNPKLNDRLRGDLAPSLYN